MTKVIFKPNEAVDLVYAISQANIKLILKILKGKNLSHITSFLKKEEAMFRFCKKNKFKHKYFAEYLDNSTDMFRELLGYIDFKYKIKGARRASSIK